MSNGHNLVDKFRRERRAGDLRLSVEGRAILQRITTGDLADQFADSLAAIGNDDPALVESHDS